MLITVKLTKIVKELKTPTLFKKTFFSDLYSVSEELKTSYGKKLMNNVMLSLSKDKK